MPALSRTPSAFELRRLSAKKLRRQWEEGPLPGHHLCSLASGAETSINRGRMARGQGARLWVITDGKNRCRSVSCRPGDAFGCSMANARRDRDRTVRILDSWMAGKREAYVGVVEVRGTTLAELLEASARAITATLEGSAWTSRRRRLAISGRLSTLRAFRAGTGEWIVRRWLVLAVEGAMHAEDADQLAQWVDDRLRRRVTLGRRFSLRPVHDFEVLALARHVTGCSSPLDPPVPVFSESIEIEFSESGEQLPEQLGWEQFIEYAVAMEGKSCWGVGRARRGAPPEGRRKGGELHSTDAWSVLVDEVRRAIPNPVYIEAVIKSDGRFNKK